MAEFDYSNTILVVKPVGSDAAASLRSEHNTNRLKSFHFEDGVSSISGSSSIYNLTQKPKNATQCFFFETDEKNCNTQLLEKPDPDKNNKYGISRQHFRIDFNWDSGFLRLNNIQSLKYNNMHMVHQAEQTKIHVAKLVFEIFPFRGRFADTDMESSRQDLDALLEPRNVVTPLGKYHEGTTQAEGKDGYGWEED